MRFSSLNCFLVSSLILSSSIALSATKVTLDPANSSFGWRGSKITGASHNGSMSFKEGHIEMDGDKVVGGTFTVDMNSLANIDLTDAENNGKLVGHLKSDDFFDVAKFPVSTLVIKKAAKQADGSYKVSGELTIKSEKQPVDFLAKLGADNKTAETNLTVDRTKWNIKYGSGKFFKGLGDKMINDPMEFTIKLAFAEPVISAAKPTAEKEKPAAKKTKK